MTIGIVEVTRLTTVTVWALGATMRSTVELPGLSQGQAGDRPSLLQTALDDEVLAIHPAQVAEALLERPMAIVQGRTFGDPENAYARHWLRVAVKGHG
jgi:hypothetical protein